MAIKAYSTNSSTMAGRVTVGNRYQEGYKFVPFSSAPNPLPPTSYFSDTWMAPPKGVKITMPNNFPPASYSGPIGAEVRGNGISGTGYPSGQYSILAYSKAYSAFWGKILNDNDLAGVASLGVSVAEGREAIEAIVDRAQRLGRAYRFLRRGRFTSFLKEIGGRPKSKHKNTVWTRPKDASALWLEYWLGWAPLVGDIQASMQVLTSSHLFPPTYVRVRKSVKWKPAKPAWCEKCLGNCSVSVAMGAYITVENPNTYLAARLGLVNWLEIGWAVVPFSFVVDWFTNIGQVLGSFSAGHTGVSLSGGWVSSYTRGTGSERYMVNSGTLYENIWEYPDIQVHLSRRVVTGTHIPRPKLYLSLPQSFKPSRAATAISLLVSIFTKG